MGKTLKFRKLHRTRRCLLRSPSETCSGNAPGFRLTVISDRKPGTRAAIEAQRRVTPKYATPARFPANRSAPHKDDARENRNGFFTRLARGIRKGAAALLRAGNHPLKPQSTKLLKAGNSPGFCKLLLVAMVENRSKLHSMQDLRFPEQQRLSRHDTATARDRSGASGDLVTNMVIVGVDYDVLRRGRNAD
jgi:hypothetical protein